MKIPARIWWAAGAGAALLVGGVIAALVSGGGAQPPAAPRARQYTARQACLLTDSKGLTDPLAAATWAGMEDASLATHAKVMYLSVSGPGTVANAIPYVNTLVERHCDMILAAGTPQTEAVAQIARTVPSTRFLLIGPQAGTASGNVIAVGTSHTTRARVAHEVESAVQR